MVSKLVILFWKLINRINRSLDESVQFSLPHLTALGLIGVFGFPLYYWIWNDLFPQPYENIEIRMIGCLLFLGLIFLRRLPARYQNFIKVYWTVSFTYALSFFFSFMLLKNDCNLVWSMSTMAGLTLLILVAHDWILTLLIFIVGSILAFAAYVFTTDQLTAVNTYWIQVPIYLFVVITGGVFNYQFSRLRQEKLKVLASLGAELAHELRTPLLSIEHHTNVLQSEINGLDTLLNSPSLSVERSAQSLEAFKKSTVYTQKEAAHANTIIDMLLMDLGSKSINENEFTFYSIHSVIDKSIQRFPFASGRDQRRIHISCDKDFLFFGSEVLLMHVLFNLIKNALRFLEDDGQIHITCERGAKQNLLLIKDRGKGIPLSQQAYIFDEFYTSSESGKGTGVGLAFCRKVMTKFNGSINCESKLGEYTTFILGFPPVSEQEVLSHQQLNLDTALASLKGKRILFTDDEPNFCHQLIKQLPGNEFQTVVLNSAQSAIEYLKINNIDLLVMDLNMPVMDGLTAIRLIRSGSVFSDNQCINHKTLPILVYSAEPQDYATGKSLAAGATSFINKKCDAREFIHELHQCIHLSNKQAIEVKAKLAMRGKTILVIDDQKMNYVSIKRKLEPLDIGVIYANHAKAAYKLLDEDSIDCILLDLYLPGINGWQIAREIRSGESFSEFDRFESVPIIGMSGDPREELLSSCHKAGMNTLIHKPVDLIPLLETLFAYIDTDPKLTAASGTPKEKARDAVPVNEQTEAVSKLLHDLVTPSLIIETNNQLYKSHFSILIGAGHHSDLQELSAESLKSLETVPDNLEQAIRLDRRKIDDFWRQFRDEAEPMHRAELSRRFVRETQILWKQIENLYVLNVAYSLPALLNQYKKWQYDQDSAQAISGEQLQALSDSIPECKNAIETVKRLLNEFNIE